MNSNLHFPKASEQAVWKHLVALACWWVPAGEVLWAMARERGMEWKGVHKKKILYLFISMRCIKLIIYPTLRVQEKLIVFIYFLSIFGYVADVYRGPYSPYLLVGCGWSAVLCENSQTTSAAVASRHSLCISFSFQVHPRFHSSLLRPSSFLPLHCC